MTSTTDGTERDPALGTETHCPYCALQCGLTLTPLGALGGGALGGAAKVPAVRFEVTARDFPTNRGAMCRKGWAAAELLDAPGRLTTPLVRRSKGGDLEPASWDEALERIASEFQRLQGEHGANVVGAFGGGGLTNETAYMLGKFVRVVLGSRSIDYNGRFCMASAAVANQKAFGIDRGLPFPLEDIPGADATLLVGANPAETMPPMMQYFDEQLAAGGKLIVVDPRRTATAEYASLHLQLTPGTDAALGNGLLHIAIKDRLIDETFIAQRTTGFEAVRRAVGRYWPDRVERITGVSVKQLNEAAHILGEASSLCTLSARGAEQQSKGVHNVLSFINLQLALGQIGKEHSGYGCLTGQGNGQGGREHGQKADQLPGYRKLNDPADRAHVAKVWGVAAADLPVAGTSACELIDEIGTGDGLRALLVMGSNLVVSAPDASHAERQLRSLELLVVADTFLSETAQLADVVLPVCHFAEHDGTMTNLEGRLLLRQKATSAPAGVKTDLEVLELIAERLGKGRHVSSVPSQVFDELGKASAGGTADYSGFSHERLRGNPALFWPCPSPDHPGTPRLFSERFHTVDGLARFNVVEFEESAERVSEAFPFYLTTGRVLGHYQTGVQTHRVKSLEGSEPEAFAQMHPQLAGSCGLQEGDWASLTTRRGRVQLRVRLSPSMRLDTVFVPFHWGGAARANTMTSRLLDPESKIPEFKLSAVAIARADLATLDEPTVVDAAPLAPATMRPG